MRISIWMPLKLKFKSAVGLLSIVCELAVFCFFFCHCMGCIMYWNNILINAYSPSKWNRKQPIFRSPCIKESLQSINIMAWSVIVYIFQPPFFPQSLWGLETSHVKNQSHPINSEIKELYSWWHPYQEHTEWMSVRCQVACMHTLFTLL